MKVYLKTFGCRANQYDTETVRAMIARGGGEVVDSPELADAAVFNSCAVTAQAEVELRKGVRRAARRRPGLRTLVMGCAAAIDRGAIAQLPSVACVLPGADFAEIAAALGLSPDALGAAPAQTGTRALLRIQDGCDEHCTFCATTLARGANRSRPIADLVREARTLGERHPEIVLTGIHIGTYGRDIGTTLGALVAALIAGVAGVRFRLSSIEATEVDAPLARSLHETGRLVPHIHAPLQSGSDRVLKRMGRHWYTATGYAEAVVRLAEGRATFALGADVIAGFPGETEDDHQATLELIERLPFTYLHVFPFSLRPGTAAERLPGRSAAETVARRAAELRVLAERKQTEYNARRLGGRADVVVLGGPGPGSTGSGLTEDYLSVRVPRGLERGSRVAAILGGTPSCLVAHPIAQRIGS